MPLMHVGKPSSIKEIIQLTIDLNHRRARENLIIRRKEASYATQRTGMLYMIFYCKLDIIALR